MEGQNIFDLTRSTAGQFISGCADVGEVLAKLGEWITEYGESLDSEIYKKFEKNVWIAKTAYVAESVSIMGPCIIGENSELRHGAFLRGNVLIGDGCVVGNSTEVKNSILFDSVQVPHFNYVGDSILGYKAHLGASAVISNVKSDKGEVYFTLDGVRRNSGRKKLGALVGDYAEIGCGAVLCPGTVIGKGATVYPLSLVRGSVPEGCIYKDKNNIVKKH